MRYRLPFAAVTAAVLFAAACSQTQSPTSPSRLSSPAGSTAAVSSSFGSWMSQASGSLAVTWSCLTEGAGCPPIQAPVGDVAQEPPAAPSNLASQVSGSTVTLSWSAPGSGPLVTTYVVQAGSGPGLSNIASFNTGSTATSLTVTGVPAGSYFVRVRAANLEGPGGVCDGITGGAAPICSGAPSNEVTLVVGGGPGPCPPPGAPTGLVGSASGSTVNLQWPAVASAIAYIIEAGSAPGASNLASFDTGSTATAFAATAPNGTYYLRIRVRTACGTSGVSNEVTVTVGSAPPPPPGAGLTGLWLGTMSPRLSGNQQVDLVESGNSLTGTVRSRPAGQAITFDLTKHPVTLALYTGNVVFEGTGGGGACGAGAHAGELRFTTGPSRLLGNFTLPAAGACPSQTITVDLLKQ